MSERIPPLNLSDLKMRLLHGVTEDRIAALEELAGYGAGATPLMPVVAEQFRLVPQSFPVALIARLYVATRSKELLASLRAVGDWSRFNVWERCDLLEAGLSELEPQLREYLARSWERSNPERPRVADALGKAGGAEALEYLQVVEFRMAEKVRTEALRLSREDHDLLDNLSHKADASFLAAVRDGIANLRSRIETEGRGG